MEIIDTLVFAFLPILVVGCDFLSVSLEKDNSSTCSVTKDRSIPLAETEGVFISWLNRPPYIYNNKEANDSETKLKGIVYEVVNKALKICSEIDSHVNYSPNATEDLKKLDQAIVQKTADIAMPVQSDVENKYGGHEYVQVMKSPGFVFIVNRQQMQDHSRHLVALAMKDTWPVVVITLLMTCLAGLLIWALVAVIADSHAYDEALKHSANVKEYTDFYQMHEALMEKREVQGILADIYTASYFMHNIGDFLLAVKMFFASQHSIGFVIRSEHHALNKCLSCLRDLFKYRQRDVTKIILRHVRVLHNETLNRRVTADDIDVMVSLLDGDSLWFRRTLHILLIAFVLMLTIGLVYEFCRMATGPPVQDKHI